jgi:hypothetical protein
LTQDQQDLLSSLQQKSNFLSRKHGPNSEKQMEADAGTLLTKLFNLLPLSVHLVDKSKAGKAGTTRH